MLANCCITIRELADEISIGSCRTIVSWKSQIYLNVITGDQTATMGRSRRHLLSITSKTNTDRKEVKKSRYKTKLLLTELVVEEVSMINSCCPVVQSLNSTTKKFLISSLEVCLT